MHKLITHAQFKHASITYLWHFEYARALEVIFFFLSRGSAFCCWIKNYFKCCLLSDKKIYIIRTVVIRIIFWYLILFFRHVIHIVFELYFCSNTLQRLSYKNISLLLLLESHVNQTYLNNVWLTDSSFAQNLCFSFCTIWHKSILFTYCYMFSFQMEARMMYLFIFAVLIQVSIKEVKGG